MSDQTVSGEVARVETAHAMLTAQTAEFAKILPAHIGPERFTRWALTVLRKPDLQEVMQSNAGQLSVMSALMDCASLGLEPGRTYHLAVFQGKNKDGSLKSKTVTGIIDYRGEVQLITNADPDCSVIAQLVHEHDDFHLTGANVPPKHDADWFNPDTRGAVVGGYSYVAYPGERFSLVVRMSETEFLKHRAKARAQNVWNDWPEPMRLKTVIHPLRKFVPWSAERRDYR